MSRKLDDLDDTVILQVETESDPGILYRYRFDEYGFRRTLLSSSLKERIKWIDPPECEELIKKGLTIPQVPTLIVHESEMEWREGFRQVSCCVLESTKTYLKNLFGITLGFEDDRWFQQNAMVTSDGVPENWAATIVHQLIEPYGLGVSKIRIWPSALWSIYKERTSWTRALGANPLFLSDGQTTNREAVEKLAGGSDKVTKALEKEVWGFDCGTEPLFPGLLMYQTDKSRVGHNGACSYVGPRGSFSRDDFCMSLRIDRLENINYAGPLELKPYEAYIIQYPRPWTLKDPETDSTLRSIYDKALSSMYKGKGRVYREHSKKRAVSLALQVELMEQAESVEASLHPITRPKKVETLKIEERWGTRTTSCPLCRDYPLRIRWQLPESYSLEDIDPDSLPEAYCHSCDKILFPTELDDAEEDKDSNVSWPLYWATPSMHEEAMKEMKETGAEAVRLSMKGRPCSECHTVSNLVYTKSSAVSVSGVQDRVSLRAVCENCGSHLGGPIVDRNQVEPDPSPETPQENTKTALDPT